MTTQIISGRLNDHESHGSYEYAHDTFGIRAIRVIRVQSQHK